MTQKINHGDIWLANLNLRRGTEPGKNRPVLIIQDQELLDLAHPSTIIIPLTTHLVDNAEPLRLRIKSQGKLTKESDLLIDQIRAIDNKRLMIGPLVHCSSQFMLRVYDAIQEVMGITYTS